MSKFVDATLSIYDEMDSFPADYHHDTEIKRTQTHQEGRCAASCFKFSSHTGTHIDAPYHFIPEGQKLDEIKVDKFIGPGVLMKFMDRGPEAEITAADIRNRGEVRKGDILIAATGWSDEHFGEKSYFQKNPYLSSEAAEMLVREEITAVGIDAPTLDSPKNLQQDKAPVHKSLLGNGIYAIESLTNLAAVPEGRIKVHALPLKIKDGDGAQARVVIEY